MVRAAVLSIVLTLATGLNATLLCSVWCHPEEAKASACPHQDAATSPRVTGEDSCRTVPVSASAFVREEPKRGSTTPGAHYAIALPRFRFDSRPTDTRRAFERAVSAVAEAPPLLIALRI